MASAAVFPPADPTAPELFDAGELELLRQFLGLPPGDERQASLGEAVDDALEGSDDDEYDAEPDLRCMPVRLSDANLQPSSVPLADIHLAEAVGRLCTSAVRKRLETFYEPQATGQRIRFPRPLARLLRPRLVCTINWSAWEWPEQYDLTWIQPLERFVVTVTSDTSEIWGCNRLALDSFGRDEPPLAACERILSWWWAWHRDLGREEGWEELRRTGVMKSRSAIRLHRSVWGRLRNGPPRVIKRVAHERPATVAAPRPLPRAVPSARSPDPFRHKELAHLEGRQFQCVRCAATGTIHRRVCASAPWPPWYVDWVRAPAAPAGEPTIQCEAQAAPMAHSFCPACRSPVKVEISAPLSSSTASGRPLADETCQLERCIVRDGLRLDLWSCSDPTPRIDAAADAPRVPNRELLVHAGNRDWWLVFVSPDDVTAQYPSASISQPGWYLGPVPISPEQLGRELEGPFQEAVDARQELRRRFPDDPEAGATVPPGEPREGYRGDPRSRRHADVLAAKGAVLTARGSAFYQQRLFLEEVRGARGLAPGPYWALSFCDPQHPHRSWLELTRIRPPPQDVPGISGTATLPDGRTCRIFGILTIQRNGRIRRAWPRERRAVGELQAVPSARAEGAPASSR